MRSDRRLCADIKKCSFVIFGRRFGHKERFLVDQRSLFTSCYAGCIKLVKLDYVAHAKRSTYRKWMRFNGD